MVISIWLFQSGYFSNKPDFLKISICLDPRSASQLLLNTKKKRRDVAKYQPPKLQYLYICTKDSLFYFIIFHQLYYMSFPCNKGYHWMNFHPSDLRLFPSSQKVSFCPIPVMHPHHPQPGNFQLISVTAESFCLYCDSVCVEACRMFSSVPDFFPKCSLFMTKSYSIAQLYSILSTNFHLSWVSI